MELSIIGTYLIGILILFIIGKTLLMPIRLIGKLLWNALIGGALLWIINLIGGAFGITIGINWLSALLVGLLGIPGVLLLLLWKLIQ